LIQTWKFHLLLRPDRVYGIEDSFESHVIGVTAINTVPDTSTNVI